VGKCTWITMIAGGVLAAAGVASAESAITASTTGANASNNVMRSATPAQLRNHKGGDEFGIARIALAPEDIGGAEMMASFMGAQPSDATQAQTNNIDQAVFCGICDFDSTAAQETALPASWTEYGDAFANRADAIAGKWLRDQGCFIIIGCFGSSNPANRLQLPAAFDYTSSLPNFKVCGTCGNFTAPNDSGTVTSIFNIQPQNAPNGPTTTPSPNCPPTITTQANQRDQDYIRFNVPAGGINNFRLFITGGQNFEGALLCNKNFPSPGVINGCWNGSQPVPAEFAFIPVVRGNGAQTTAPVDGGKDTTWAWPPDGVVTNLPEGQYIITYRLQPFANLNPPNVVTEGSRQYQVRVIGDGGPAGTGACCNVSNNTCVDNQTNAACRPNQNPLFFWRGAGTLCSDGLCGAVSCPGATAEGPTRDCIDGSVTASDNNAGCLAAAGTEAADIVTPGTTYSGHCGVVVSGVNAQQDFDAYDYVNGGATAKQVTFTLNSEMPMGMFGAFADANNAGGGGCTGVVYVGFFFANPSRGDTLKACVPAGGTFELLLLANTGNISCGSTDYCLSVAETACEAGACCNLSSGNCTSTDSLSCYGSGGIFLGEGTTCATSTCCSAASACAGSTLNEGEPAANCVNSSNYTDVATRDTFDSGCDTTNPSFVTVNPGDKVCGTTSQYQNNPDTDWYTVTIAGADSYIGFQLSGNQVDMDINFYRQLAGVSCPGDPTTLPNQLVGSDSSAGCGGIAIVGDCLPAGTYFVQVAARFSAGDVPCPNAASYLLSVLNNVCVGTAVTCPGGGVVEGEANCQATASDEGCNAASPVAGSFIAMNCGQTACGTCDLLAGVRDTDWYVVQHGGGQFKVTLTSQFFGAAFVVKKGTTGPQGCDDSVVEDGLAFVTPNTATVLTIASLASGTYYVVVAPDFAGTSRICCGTNYTVKVECASLCPCTANLIDNPPSDVCKVNTNDLTILLGNFGKFCTGFNAGQPVGSVGRCPNGYLAGDFNQDGTVNTGDLTVLLGQFGKQNVGGVCQ